MTNKKRILIVEDHSQNCRLYEGIFECYPYSYDIVHTGEDALQYLEKKQNPDLILLDIVLSGIDGFEFFEIIQSKISYQDIKVIAVTALSDEETQSRIKDMSFDGYLQKPIVIDCLDKLLVHFLQDKDLI